MATPQFLLKFETKSARVKGLSFHSRRPWLLASLHTGEIQLWDYVVGSLVERFVEYECPVRSVDFHSSQPLFVSGGDDGKIKVWNYRRRKSDFTLAAHSDYVRTVQFHTTNPWILSACDDFTVRVWNWQSRSCIATLSGHGGYVMCAQFHPDPMQPLVVSASLDGTVRVWDLTGLKSKTAGPSDFTPTLGGNNAGVDFFGNTDAIVKYQLEGHDRGVNWACFHPSAPFILSGGDDRTIRVWRIDDSRAWETSVMRGHSDNVSSMVWLPELDAIISNSEDMHVRVWDGSRHLAISSFRRDADRYWILSKHPKSNLLAAGHDNGFVVFKIVHERPAFTFCAGNNTLYFERERHIRSLSLTTNRELPVVSMRRGNRRMWHSFTDRALLVWSSAEGGSYALIKLHKDNSAISEADVVRGVGAGVAFAGRQRFAIVDRSNTMTVRSFENDVVKKVELPFSNVDGVFQAPGGNVVVRNDERVALFDPTRKRVLAESELAGARDLFWSPDNSRVAVITKQGVFVCNRSLRVVASTFDQVHVKSGCWYNDGAFVYTTLLNVKYVLVTGDSGVICTLDRRLYLATIAGDKAVFYDRVGSEVRLPFNDVEIKFKQALYERRFEDVLKFVRSKALVGESLVAFLQRKGFPEVALHLVEDDTVRLDLAIECGNLEVALQAAQRLDTDDGWRKLGDAALAQGNQKILQMTLQRTNAFERLSFLYAILGDTDKSRKMLQIAVKRQDSSAVYHNAVLCGDAVRRVETLEAAGLLKLAYASALKHGLADKAAQLAARLGDGELPNVPGGADGELLLPPTPIVREENWPLLNVQRTLISNALDKQQKAFDVEVEDVDGAGWGDDDDDVGGHDAAAAAGGDGVGGDAAADAGGGWEMDDDGVELPDVPAVSAVAGAVLDSAPQAGASVAAKWAAGGVVGDLVAAGDFVRAFRQLQSAAGVVNFAPLKASFLQYAASVRCSVPLHVSTPSTLSLLGGAAAPCAFVTMDQLVERLKNKCYKLTTEGSFEPALQAFQSIIVDSLLLAVNTRPEEDEINELIDICREYVIGLTCELQRRQSTNAVRQAELAAYFTHCEIQPVHRLLALRSAMLAAAKIKHYPYAAILARRVLDSNPPAQAAQKARQVIALVDSSTDGGTPPAMSYDPRNPFVLDAKNLVPIYQGSPCVRCPLCRASFGPACEGALCNICGLAEIGAAKTSGMRWRRLIR